MKNIESCKSGRVGKLLSRFLKDGADVLAKPNFVICNLSISQGVIPKVCKVVKLKPIFKKGKKTEPFNYRTISLFKSISKIIERFIYDQTNTFLSNEDILYNCRSGFWGDSSTNLRLSLLTDKVLKEFGEDLLSEMLFNL